MWRILLIILACTSFNVLASAAQPSDNLDALKQRIEHASPSDQIKLSLEVAETQLQHADAFYKSDDNANALRALQDVETYGVRAANTSAQTRKHMKHTEIAVRKLSAKLDDIARNVDIDQRPPIKAAMAKIDKAHDDLLSRMFAK